MWSTVFALWMLRSIVRVNLHNLSVVHVRTEGAFDCLDVAMQGIGRNLHLIPLPTSNVLHELIGDCSGTLSALEGRD